MSLTSESEFAKELESLINKHCRENESNTPDFILAKYLCACLDAFDDATERRDTWYGPDDYFPDELAGGCNDVGHTWDTDAPDAECLMCGVSKR